MKFSFTILIFLVYVSFGFVSCSSKSYPVGNMSEKNVKLIINKVEVDASGELFIHGKVVNQGESVAMIPWLGNANDENVILTSHGILEYKMPMEWKVVSRFEDGIRPLVSLEGGQSVNFLHKPSLTNSAKKGKYRLTMPNIQPIEFDLK